MRTLFVALRAVTFATGFIFLWSWVALGVRNYDRQWGTGLPAWTGMPGIVLMGAGGILVLVCLALFIVRGRGTPAIFDPPREFVAGGPYRYARNPMYIGVWALLAGFGLYERSFSVLLFSLAWFLLFHLFVVFFEEPDLHSRFGTPYEEYCKTVPRWIPKLKPGARQETT